MVDHALGANDELWASHVFGKNGITASQLTKLRTADGLHIDTDENRVLKVTTDFSGYDTPTTSLNNLGVDIEHISSSETCPNARK